MKTEPHWKKAPRPLLAAASRRLSCLYILCILDCVHTVHSEIMVCLPQADFFFEDLGVLLYKKHIPVCILNLFSALKHPPNRQKIPPAALSFAQNLVKLKSYGFKSCFQIPAIPTRLSNGPQIVLRVPYLAGIVSAAVLW